VQLVRRIRLNDTSVEAFRCDHQNIIEPLLLSNPRCSNLSGVRARNGPLTARDRCQAQTSSLLSAPKIVERFLGRIWLNSIAGSVGPEMIPSTLARPGAAGFWLAVILTGIGVREIQGVKSAQSQTFLPLSHNQGNRRSRKLLTTEGFRLHHHANPFRPFEMVADRDRKGVQFRHA
jgi:hypothetical protein